MELYIHIPFCARKCLYCDFLSAPYDADIRRSYTKALCREIAYYGKRLHEPIETVYIGGGTPSWLETDLFGEIMESVHTHFPIEKKAEITMECNPGTVTREAMARYVSCGINRVSIGLQSANDKELALLGRIHTFGQFLKTYEYAREAGIRNINIDVMTGLPQQTPDMLKYTLRQILMLRPEHISAYALMIEEGTPFYERYGEDATRQAKGEPTKELPDEEDAIRLQELSDKLLKEHGYVRYEISNYAKEGFACRHNRGYWRRRPYLGVGLGAASFLGHTRYRNAHDIYRYIEGAGKEHMATSECTPLSKKDEMAEFMYLGLRETAGVARADFKEAFGVSMEAIYGEVNRRLQEEGLLCAEEGRIRLTERGFAISNYVFTHFLLDEA